MSKWDKLIIRICNLSKTFGLMNCERYWKVTDMKCMHREVEAAIILSEKKGCMPITIPKHEPIRKVYVEMVRQIVESEAKNDEDAE